MKVSVDFSRIIECLLAGSALKALCGDNASGLLTPDRDEALRRVIAVAAADVASALAGQLKSVTIGTDCITCLFADSVLLAAEALEMHIEHALTVAALHQLALNAGDCRRADTYRSCFRDAVSSLGRAIDAIPPHLRLRPSYF